MRLFLLNNPKHLKPLVGEWKSTPEPFALFILDLATRDDLLDFVPEPGVVWRNAKVTDLLIKMGNYPSLRLLWTIQSSLLDKVHLKRLQEMYWQEDFNDRFNSSMQSRLLRLRKLIPLTDKIMLRLVSGLISFRVKISSVFYRKLWREFAKFDEVIFTFLAHEKPSRWQSHVCLIARDLGLPTSHRVLSFDNLTNRAPSGFRADRCLVWGEWQGKQAENLYNYEPSECKFEGTRIYRPIQDISSVQRRRKKKHRVLKVLYLGSSKGVSSALHESFVVDEVGQLIESRFGNCAISVRAHPTKKLNQVVGKMDDDIAGSVKPEGLAKLYQEITEADIVIGMLTSSMLEAIIIGIPTVSVPFHLHERIYPHHIELVRIGVFTPIFSAEMFLNEMESCIKNPDIYSSRQAQNLRKFLGEETR